MQGPVVLKPESKGTITVNSSNVYDKPVIDPKYGGIPCHACRILISAASLPQRTI